MNLRQATLFIVGLLSVAGVMVMVLVSELTLMSGYADLERDQVRTDVLRVEKALERESSRIMTQLKDWAYWDDAVRFVAGRDDAFVDSNLADVSFANLQVDVMLFFAPDGRLVYAKRFDAGQEAEVPLPAEFLAAFAPDSPWVRFSRPEEKRSGLLRTGGDVFMVCALPILDSSGKGPVRGAMVMARVVGRVLVEDVSRDTLLDLDLVPVWSREPEGEAREALAALAGGGDIQVRVVGSNQVDGYALLRDVEGEPVFLLRVSQDRRITHQGRSSVRYNAVNLSLILLLAGLALYLLIDRRILSRIAALSREVVDIGAHRGVSRRVEATGRDEVARLADAINTMLAAREQSDRDLRLSEERLRTLINTMPDMVCFKDGEGRLLEANACYLHLFGQDWTGYLGKNSPEQAPLPSFLQAFLRHSEATDESAWAAMVPHREEEVISRPDGRAQVFDVIKVPMFHGDGGRKGLVVVGRDITEMRQASADLEAARQRAEAANRAKSMFLANMSHEIRTPLNGILGMLQLLESSSLDGEQEKFVNLAVRASERLTRLLSDILDLSRVEAGRLSIQSEPFLLRTLLHSVEHLFHPPAEQSGIALDIQVHPEVPDPVLGDPLRLQQVLNNLVGNAFKFTSAGRVVVDVRPLPGKVLGQFRVLFTVLDTGCGIPEENLPELFTPFTQVSEGHARKYQGAGLGLSISRHLVELMDGEIAVESEVGVGTSFSFCIPFGVAGSVGPAPRETAAVPPPLGLCRVLLAEDDPVNSLAAKHHLERAGYAVTVVEDGRQAIAALRQGDFGAVLMDVQMPVMDGMEAVRAIRRGEAGPDKSRVPIIALTAYAMAGEREKFLAGGMDGYVSKPFDFEELSGAIGKALHPVPVPSGN